MDEKLHQEPTTDANPQSAAAPVMDVIPPPIEKVQDEAESNEQSEPTANDNTPPPPDDNIPNPMKPKTRRPNTSLAIVATVIIVLGLAVLAVFAFLKSNK